MNANQSTRYLECLFLKGLEAFVSIVNTDNILDCTKGGKEKEILSSYHIIASKLCNIFLVASSALSVMPFASQRDFIHHRISGVHKLFLPGGPHHLSYAVRPGEKGIKLHFKFE